MCVVYVHVVRMGQLRAVAAEVAQAVWAVAQPSACVLCGCVVVHVSMLQVCIVFVVSVCSLELHSKPMGALQEHTAQSAKFESFTITPISTGDAIALILPMTPLAVACYLGIILAGGVVVGIAGVFLFCMCACGRDLCVP